MKVQSAAVSTTVKPKKKKKIFTKEALQCYAMIAPHIIGFLVLTVYPILWTFRWSWFSYSGIPSETQFVGWDNFVRMFTTDFTYWKVWGNTLLFAICKMPIELTLAMVIALLLNQKKLRGSNFFRTIFYLPNVISVVIIGLIFSNMFSFEGIINTWLVNLGIVEQGVDWFATRAGAMTVLVAGSIWNTFGLNVMYFIAALSNVPEELYESARLDGAGKITTFFKVTLPMIAPVFQTIILLSIVGTLSVNEYIIAVAGNSMKTNTVMSYLTQQFMPGFATDTKLQLGYGCAMSLVTTIIFAFIALGYNKLSKKLNSVY